MDVPIEKFQVFSQGADCSVQSDPEQDPQQERSVDWILPLFEVNKSYLADV